MKLTLSNSDNGGHLPDPLSNRASNARMRDALFLAAGALLYWALATHVTYFSGLNLTRLSPFFAGAAGYFFGFRAGLAASVAALVVHTLVFNQHGYEGPFAILQYKPAAHIGTILVGPLAGRLRTVSNRLQKEIELREKRELEQSEAKQRVQQIDDVSDPKDAAPDQQKPETVYQDPAEKIPVVDDTVPVDVEIQKSPVPSDGSATVLVAQDEPAVQRLIRDVLHNKGYRVLLADDGGAALKVAAAGGSIDLLITDVVMPRVNGRELAEELRLKHPHLKVLYISGYIGKASVRVAELGPDTSFLSKPFSSAALTRKIRLLLQNPQAESTPAGPARPAVDSRSA